MIAGALAALDRLAAVLPAAPLAVDLVADLAVVLAADFPALLATLLLAIDISKERARGALPTVKTGSAGPDTARIRPRSLFAAR
jgi:hypothetical protein